MLYENKFSHAAGTRLQANTPSRSEADFVTDERRSPARARCERQPNATSPQANVDRLSHEEIYSHITLLFAKRAGAEPALPIEAPASGASDSQTTAVA